MDDVDLRSASHEKAVDVIRAAGNPVRFLVQSLVQWVSFNLFCFKYVHIRDFLYVVNATYVCKNYVVLRPCK